jgi:hypothetical protein
MQSLNSTKKFFFDIMSLVFSLPWSISQAKKFGLGILLVFHISRIVCGA